MGSTSLVVIEGEHQLLQALVVVIVGPHDLRVLVCRQSLFKLGRNLSRSVIGGGPSRCSLQHREI